MATKKAFGQMAAKLLGTKRWTLGNYRQQLKDEMAGQSWRLMIPGVKNSPQYAEVMGQLAIMDALTPEELDDHELMKNGLRVRRVAKKTGRPEVEVMECVRHFQRQQAMHTFFHERHAAGMPLPTTIEETQLHLAREPRYREVLATRRLFQDQKRRIRRGW